MGEKAPIAMSVHVPDELSRRRQAVRNAAEKLLLDARADGRSDLNQGEAARFELMRQELTELDAELERRSQIDETLSHWNQRINARMGGPPKGTTTMLNDQRAVYRQHDHRASWIRDLVRFTQNTDDSGESRRRLQAHAEQVTSHQFYTDRPEYRDLSSVVEGSGSMFVPPMWLVDQYAEFARAGRVAADIIQRQPLPGGTNQISVPKILQGTQTAIQTADNAPVNETDLEDTYISADIRTIAGQQSVSVQLIEQSPISFDTVVMDDLTAAYNQNLDQQVLYGSGTSGQLLGFANWPGIGTVSVADQTIPSLYAALANAINKIWTTRFAAPTAILMHPRRWATLLASLDQNFRPLFLPEANHPMNAAGLQDNVEPQSLVGRALGLPIYTDANVAVNLGAGSPSGSQDAIYVLRTKDIVLFEGGIRGRIYPEPLATTLTVLIQLYAFSALLVRYPASIVEVTGLDEPTF